MVIFRRLRWGRVLAGRVTLLALFLLSGCSHFLSPQVAEEEDPCHIEQLRSGLAFYDLSGATAVALTELNACIDGAGNREKADRRRLRAETLLDLLVYEKVVRLVDPGVADRVSRLLVESMEGYLDSATGEQMSRLIEGDLRDSGAPEPYTIKALELLSFELQGEDPASAFARFTHSRVHGERLRLLFAGMMTVHLSPWGERPAQPLTWEDYRSISWLCADELPSSISELAISCGYWCVSDEGIDSGFQAEEPLRPGLRETPGDEGYELVRRCGEAYFALPEEGDVVLLSQHNFIDMLILNTAGELLMELEEDLLGGDPLIQLSAALIDSLRENLGRLRGPLQLTPAAFHYDPRLVLPQQGRTGGGELLRRTSLFSPLVSVLSTGIYVGAVPHVMLSQDARGVYRLSYWGVEEGFHFPGQEVVRFSGLNQSGDFGAQEGFLGELALSLGGVHRWIMGDMSAESAGETGSAGALDCTAVGIEGISILLDHMTPQAALEAVLRTAMGCGVQLVHMYSTDVDESLWRLPIERVVQRQTRMPHHLLEVTEEDFFVLTMEGEEVPSSSTSMSQHEPFCALYTSADEILRGSEEAAPLPLMIVVNSSRFDAGMLVNMVDALSMNRPEFTCENDMDLFSFDPEIASEQLFPGGLVLGI